ncbi:MAG TPA: C40 family peptidase [Mucilaginibacter sp.]|nr:C40 family peptidase [Mucilaginibacter sp.]
MRQKLLTLITLLCLFAVSAGFGYARKAHRLRHKTISRKSVNYTIQPVNRSLQPDSVSADSILEFAESLIGTRYRPATADPERGFDCSGFVNYVFKNFDFDVPRSSREFINVGEKVSYEDALPGDIILFTSPTNRHRIGHVGIVVSNSDEGMKFIHSTSGKEYGVTITEMDANYKRRFVQIIRVIPQNNDTELASR